MARDKSEKRPSFFGRLLKLLLILLLLAAVVGYVIPLFEQDKGERVDGAGDWMAGLDDGAALNALAIPGTHDSATQYVTLAFFGKCQTKSVGEQLEAGYRYLDIRLAADGTQLKLMHGFVNCKTGIYPWSDTLYLDAVLSECYDFLAKHPTETVLFAVKQEHGKESVAEFQRLLDSYIQKNPERWLLTDRVPTLGQARGKLVLLRRYADEAQLGWNAGIPFWWEGQSGSEDMTLSAVAQDNGTYMLWVQDRFCYPVEEKWTAFLAGLGLSRPQDGEVSVSFLSTKGKLPFGHPYKYASSLNLRLLGREIKPEDGWIVVDFATAPLAKHIYEVNFQ